MFDPKMGYCVEFGQMLWLLVGSPKNGRTGAQNPEIGRVADSQKYTSPIFGHFGSNGDSSTGVPYIGGIVALPHWDGTWLTHKSRLIPMWVAVPNLFVVHQTVSTPHIFVDIKKCQYLKAAKLEIWKVSRSSYAKVRSLLSPSARPSLYPSHLCIVSRRLKISSNFFLGPVAPSF